jgi:5-methyltetrahydropteroyltriglutamate--homocysteine methyltransferase
MKRSEDRILTTHTGKLFRPGAGWVGMIEATTPSTPEEVRAIVEELVAAQVKIGLDVISNGEPAGMGPFNLHDIIDGIELKPYEEGQSWKFLSREHQQYADFYSNDQAMHRMMGAVPAFLAMRQVVTGPLRLKTLDPLHRDLRIFNDALHGKTVTEAFYNVISPLWAEEFLFNEYYNSDFDMTAALADAMAPMFKAVVDTGLLLQLDDAAITHEWEEVCLGHMTLAQYERFIMPRVEVQNAALAGVPEDRIRYHICWASNPGLHIDNIPLKDIVRMLLQVKAQAYLIESAKATHQHEWKVWRDVVRLPEGKILIPGVVDHTTNVVEHPEVIADRLITFANVVGRENVMAGTDCGMRGHATANWLKYQNIVKGAQLASKQLW